jgi:uncharacterized protein (DUF1697 family)
LTVAGGKVPSLVVTTPRQNVMLKKTSARKQPLHVYVALLRGVNVGGNNMISMSALKKSFTELGFTGVESYINSGNIIFTTKETDARKLEKKIEEMLAKEYDLGSKVVVRGLAEMEKLVQSLPPSWGEDSSWRYNVIFLRHTIDTEDILADVPFNEDVEEIVYRPGTLLWSAQASEISRSKMTKLSSRKMSQEMTVRNLNTTKKLCALMKKAAESRLLIAIMLVVVSVLCVGPGTAQPGREKTHKQGVIINSVPREINTSARYLFYVSGYIVADGNTRPNSPKFGVYEYQQILDTFKDRGFVVISEARKQSTEIEPYAAKVAAQVKQLLKAGVPPRNITVVGASQGGWIAMLVSTYVANRDVNYVFIAVCASDDGFLKATNLHGNVLFISERTDLPGSCQRFRDDATGISDYNSIEVNTGLKHGFLYRPLKEWVEPAVEWAQRSR